MAYVSFFSKGGNCLSKKRYLDENGVKTLVSSIKSYVSSVAGDKIDSNHDHDTRYYTKTQIDSMEFITTADIDEICGSNIVNASEVTF